MKKLVFVLLLLVPMVAIADIVSGFIEEVLEKTTKNVPDFYLILDKIKY